MARAKQLENPKPYLTTYDVAKLLGVCTPTVVNWVKRGRIAAHTTPGGHRRIAREDLMSFARREKYPIPNELTVVATPPSAVKVLVVDDLRDFCIMVRDFLSLRGGYEVEVADSGFQAGFVVAQFKPQVILMDILMPDMDGFEVLRMLQENPETRSIPVIACTAIQDPRIEERVRREAFVGYLEKPLRLERLADALNRAVSRGVLARA